MDNDRHDGGGISTLPRRGERKRLKDKKLQSKNTNISKTTSATTIGPSANDSYYDDDDDGYSNSDTPGAVYIRGPQHDNPTSVSIQSSPHDNSMLTDTTSAGAAGAADPPVIVAHTVDDSPLQVERDALQVERDALRKKLDNIVDGAVAIDAVEASTNHRQPPDNYDEESLHNNNDRRRRMGIPLFALIILVGAAIVVAVVFMSKNRRPGNSGTSLEISNTTISEDTSPTLSPTSIDDSTTIRAPTIAPTGSQGRQEQQQPPTGIPTDRPSEFAGLIFEDWVLQQDSNTLEEIRYNQNGKY